MKSETFNHLIICLIVSEKVKSNNTILFEFVFKSGKFFFSEKITYIPVNFYFIRIIFPDLE